MNNKTANAYGWTRPKGEFYFSQFNILYTIQEAGFSRPNNGIQELFFTEYGLTDKITIGAKTSFIESYLPTKEKFYFSGGFDYVDLYINFQIYKNDKIGIMISPVVKTPGKYYGDYGVNTSDMFFCQNFWQPGIRIGFGWKITEKDIFMFRFDWFAYFIGHNHTTRPWGGVWHTDAQLRFNVDYLHILNNKWMIWGYIMTYSNIVYNMKNAADLGYKSTFDYFYKRNIVILGAGAFYNFNEKLMFHASIWTQVKTPLLLSDNNMVSYGITIGFDYKFNIFS